MFPILPSFSEKGNCVVNLPRNDTCDDALVPSGVVSSKSCPRGKLALDADDRYVWLCIVEGSQSKILLDC